MRADQILVYYILYIFSVAVVSLFILFYRNNREVKITPVSYLIKAVKPFDRVYQLMILGYGLFSLTLPIYFVNIYGWNFYTVFAFISLCLVCLGTIVTGLITVRENEPLHEKLGAVMFVGVALTSLIFSASYKYLGREYIVVSLVSLLVGIAVLLLFRKAIVGFKDKSYAPYEWILYLLTISWNMLLAFTIMVQFYGV